MKKLLILSVIAISLTGCSSFYNGRSISFKEAFKDYYASNPYYNKKTVVWSEVHPESEWNNTKKSVSAVAYYQEHEAQPSVQQPATTVAVAETTSNPVDLNSVGSKIETLTPQSKTIRQIVAMAEAPLKLKMTPSLNYYSIKSTPSVDYKEKYKKLSSDV